MTGPMKCWNSETEPWLILATSERSVSLKSPSQSDLATYRRESALHFWPWYSNAPRIAPMAAARTSADGCTSWKFLPPVSPTTRG